MSKMQCKYCLSEQMIGITAYRSVWAGWFKDPKHVDQMEINFCEDCGLVTVVRLAGEN